MLAMASDSSEILKSLRRALVAGVALSVMAGVATQADAASRKKVRHSESKASKREAPKLPFGHPLTGQQLQIVVSIANQHLSLYADGVKIAQAPVSTGIPGHRTPMGVFSVIEKDRYHHSNIYSGAPMPFMHRITWSGVAIHEGPLPGGPASHGCIRTTHDFVSRLWQVSSLGLRVIVSRTDIAPYEFSHPLLFNPAQKPASTPSAAIEFDGLRPSFGQLGDGYQAPKVRLAWAASVRNDATPIQIQQPQAAPTPSSEAAPVELPPPAKDPVVEVPAPKAEAPAVRQATEPKAAAAPVETVTPAGRATPSETATTTTATPTAATPTLAPAAADVDTTASTKTPDSGAPGTSAATAETPAPGVAPAAETAVAPAAETPAASTANSNDLPMPAFDPAPLPRPSPVKKTADLQKFRGHVAVYISRKDMKIYVRQGFVPLFDMPIQIADPKQPLGIHVFTALGLMDDGAKLRWNAITMPPPAASRASEHMSRRGKKGRKVEPKPEVVSANLPTAKEALDRITIPQEAIERISEIITPGSSLVVSDQGLGRETGRYTDFIVETN